MPTSTISNTMTDAAGVAVANTPVVISLYPKGGFRIDTFTEVTPVYITSTNASGLWSAVLEENANITPSGTYYVAEEQIPASRGGARRWAFQVGTGDATLLASLVDVLPDVEGSGYLTQATGDARYFLAGALGGTAADSRPNDTQAGGVSTAPARADHRHDREVTYGTNAQRLALTGTDLYEGLLWRNTDTFRLCYTYRASTWVPALDEFYVTNSAARLAIANPYEGMKIYQADNDTVYRYDGSNWWTVEVVGNGMTSFTPIISQGAGTPNITKSLFLSEYRITQGICEWWFSYAMTGAGTAGQGVGVTMPVPPANPTAIRQVGGGMIYDSSGSTVDTGPWEIAGAGTVLNFHSDAGTNNVWGITPSIALGPGDLLRGHVRYTVASAA